MDSLYGQDLAYIHAAGFGGLARGAAPEIVRRLQSAASPIHRVVDVGCGAGPLAAHLVAAGFEVTGVDPSADLIGLARAAVPQADFLQASIYEIELPACEAIIAIGEPLTYHAAGADADRLLHDLFRRVSAALPAGGMFIFDVIETGEPPLTGRSWLSGEDWAVMAETSEDPPAHTLTRGIETFRRTGDLYLRDLYAGDLYRRGRETHNVRLFDAAELSGKLSACGFTVETARAYGAYALPPRRRAFFCTRGAIL